MENKVAKKPIIQIDIEAWMPREDEIIYVDIADFLFNKMIVKEKDFREKVDAMALDSFEKKYVCLYNSTPAIVPLWAYMLLTAHISEMCIAVFFGKEDFYSELMTYVILNRDLAEYKGKRVVIKGCGNLSLDTQPFLTLTQRLSPIVRSMAFGESCSMIPLYKNVK